MTIYRLTYSYHNSVVEVAGTGLQEAAEKFIRESGKKAGPKENVQVEVNCERMKISDGEIVWLKCSPISVKLPNRPYTREEYEKELESLLDSIPTPFHSFVKSQAYEIGHSCGYEEVLSLAQGIVFDLRPAIEAYAKNLRGNLTT